MGEKLGSPSGTLMRKLWPSEHAAEITAVPAPTTAHSAEP